MSLIPFSQIVVDGAGVYPETKHLAAELSMSQLSLSDVSWGSQVPASLNGSTSPAASDDSSSTFSEENDFGDLDSRDWKHHDHYALLGHGLTRTRYLATQEDIKKAYRKAVLKYHPDKKAQNSGGQQLNHEGDGEDSLFKCIQKAWEILNDSERRRQFDSVDPTFDESIPSVVPAARFFVVFAPIFERNARFSKKQPVPSLGDLGSTKASVDAFYEFWYNFESWRTFEFLDEDDVESADNRMDKRYQERKNKAARQKHKNEDNARLIRLVETAYKCDPRISMFKEAEKQAKAKKKEDRVSKGRIEKEQSVKKEAEEKRLKEEEETKAKTAAMAAKKAKEAERNAARKAKKAIKTFFADRKYCLGDPTDLAALEVVLVKIEATMAAQSNEQLKAIAEKLEKATDDASALHILEEEYAKIQPGYPSSLGATLPAASSESSSTSAAASHVASASALTTKQMQLLIKAIKIYPGGHLQRWETVTSYVNQHSQGEREGEAPLSVEQIVSAAKAIQQTGMAALEGRDISEPDRKKKERDPRVDEHEPSVGYDRKELLLATVEKKDAESPETQTTPWTFEEQTCLEAALRAIPADDEKRWNKVASLLPGRSRRECMLRVRELAIALNPTK